MVRPKGNSKFIEYQLPGFSYVTIGRRGHSPTLFPEVYNEDGSTNLKMAMQLYGSEQHIEDINCIRLDLIKKGYLKKNQKIMLFGGSGAGFLVQQFLSKYGEFVSKALIYVSGAPDIAQKKGIMEFNIFKDYNPEAFKLMKSLKLTDSSSISKLCSILYDIGRRNYEPKKKQIEFLREVTTDQYLKNLKYWINPRYSPWFMDKTLQLPFGCCIKVRLYELYGNAQKKYLKRTTDEICLALESISYVLRDLIKAEKDGIIELPSFNINRSSFSGQMLVVSGSKDVAFTSEIGELVAKSYSNSKFALFDDGHSMFLDPKFHFALKKAFFEGGGSTQKTSRSFLDTN